MLFAGIDAGQSSTTAAIGDGRAVLGRGRGGPGDELGENARSTRLRDALQDALAAALRDAGLAPDTRFDAIVAGISGYAGRPTGVAPDLPAGRIELMHDAPIAHVAALSGGPGVVVIAGTGSAAYARAADGRTRNAGGWGYLFGDEGSAFWIARTAFERTIAHPACGTEVARHFGETDLRAVAAAFYAGRLGRTRFAAFARVCIERAQDAAACACWREPVATGARELALLAGRAALDPPGDTALAFTGGLMRAPSFAARVHAQARELLPGCTIVEPSSEPAEGALLLASRL